MSFGYFNGSVWGRRRILVAAPLVLEPVDAPKGLAHGDVEELEELVELLLLEVYGALLLQGLLEVELDYGVQGLEGRLFRDCWVVLPLLVLFIVCHWREREFGERGARVVEWQLTTRGSNLTTVFIGFVGFELFRRREMMGTPVTFFFFLILEEI